MENDAWETIQYLQIDEINIERHYKLLANNLAELIKSVGPIDETILEKNRGGR